LGYESLPPRDLLLHRETERTFWVPGLFLVLPGLRYRPVPDTLPVYARFHIGKLAKRCRLSAVNYDTRAVRITLG
jgi:hypothetical protein